jgi:hypothetical protein
MSQELEALEISIEEAKAKVELMEALDSLGNNSNFKKVILDGYFKNEASRLVLLKAVPSMQSEAQQLSISKSIDAIGHLRQYFSTVYQLGNMAKQSIVEDEATREELLSEEIELN